MNHPVGGRHLARQDKGNRPRQEANEQEKAADQLKQAANPEQGSGWRHSHLRRGKTENLRAAVQQENQRGDNPEQAQRLRCVTAFEHVAPFPVYRIENLRCWAAEGQTGD